MTRFFKKPLLIGALVLMLTMAVAGSAFAFSNSFNGTVSPGARVCLAPQPAASYMDAQGTASPYARFQVLWGPTSSTVSTVIYQSTDYTAGFHATFSKTYNPGDFPGYFRVCARNTATVPAQITLTQSGY